MNEEMVERVARAMAPHQGVTPGDNEDWEVFSHQYIAMARAAIAVMQEVDRENPEVTISNCRFVAEGKQP